MTKEYHYQLTVRDGLFQYPMSTKPVNTNEVDTTTINEMQ